MTLADNLAVPVHRWTAACHFDFNAINAAVGPILTTPNQRAYFRLRSDGRMYYATIPLDYDARARHVPDSGYWGAITNAVEIQFARYLDEAPSHPAISEHEFWQEVGRQQARLGARDPLVMEVVGGYGNVGE